MPLCAQANAGEKTWSCNFAHFIPAVLTRYISFIVFGSHVLQKQHSICAYLAIEACASGAQSNTLPRLEQSAAKSSKQGA